MTLLEYTSQIPLGHWIVWTYLCFSFAFICWMLDYADRLERVNKVEDAEDQKINERKLKP